MFPAARLTDAVGCPVCGTGVISLVKQYKTVIAMFPAARATDICMCLPPGAPIAKGSMKVLISGFPAARVTDIAGHGGMIAKGELKVLIGG